MSWDFKVLCFGWPRGSIIVHGLLAFSLVVYIVTELNSFLFNLINLEFQKSYKNTMPQKPLIKNKKIDKKQQAANR